jgi:hypothetical protein
LAPTPVHPATLKVDTELKINTVPLEALAKRSVVGRRKHWLLMNNYFANEARGAHASALVRRPPFSIRERFVVATEWSIRKAFSAG